MNQHFFEHRKTPSKVKFSLGPIVDLIKFVELEVAGIPFKKLYVSDLYVRREEATMSFRPLFERFIFFLKKKKIFQILVILLFFYEMKAETSCV